MSGSFALSLSVMVAWSRAAFRSRFENRQGYFSGTSSPAR